MASNTELPCWEIMKCDNPENCKAYHNPATPCWEIADAQDDYRSAFDVCQDCVVYLLKENNTVLLDKDKKDILEKKGVCVLA